MPEIIIICPLGSECEGIKNNQQFRCAWYTHLVGQNPQGGPPIDEWKCAMAWMPLMLVENAQTNRGQTAALESFRNEMAEGQQTFNNLISAAASKRIG